MDLSRPEARRWACLSLIILAASPLSSLGAPARPEPAPPAISPEDKEAIVAENSVEKLIDLCKNHVLQRSFPAAAAAVEKAIRIQPDLLTDAKPQTPRAWNEFWFTQRARIQEQKLAKTDALGRVNIAQWLYDAGLASQAAQLVSSALAINKELPEAQALVKKWNLSTTPVRIDFTYGLTQPLFVESMKDHGVDIMLVRNREFLIVPISFSATDVKIQINKAVLKATSDDGKICPIRGIAVLEGGGGDAGSDANAAASIGKLPELKWPTEGDPLWERVGVQQKPDKSGFELVCYDTTGPVPKPAPRPTPVPGQRNTPPPARGTPGGPTAALGKQTKPGGGHVAFVVEVPQAMKSMTLDYHGLDPLKVDRTFLQSLAGITKETTPSQRDEILNALLAATAAKEGAIASAAVWKLSIMRPAGGTNSGQPNDAVLPAGSVDRINKALLTAIAHPDGPTHQAAFDALFVRKEPLAEPLLQQIRSFPEPAVMLALLESLKTSLSQHALPEPGQTAPPSSTLSSETVAHVVEKLPVSPAPAGLFSAASACLANKDVQVRRKAAEVLLADGSRESVDAVARVVASSRDGVAAELGKVTNPELKGALLRVLLLKADPASAARVLAAAGPITLTITREDDPLLAALNVPSSPPTLELLIELLARSDLSAVAGSDRFRQNLDLLVNSQRKEKAVCKALLQFALAQIERLPYEAPVKRQPTQGMLRSVSAFESVLANLALSGDASTTKLAAMALIRTGRIATLSERLAQAPPGNRLKLVEAIAGERSLWDLESLPIFLAGRLADQDQPTVQKAVTLLDGIYNRVNDPKRRWRLNLGIKQGIEAKQLLDLSINPEEKVAAASTQLLIGLSMMPTAEAEEFKGSADRSAREQKLTTVDQAHQNKPAGSYMAMLYLDLKPFETAQTGAPPPIPPTTAPAAPPVARMSMPLPGGPIQLQTSGSVVHVMADGNDISVSPPGGGQNSSGPPTMKINAGMLLRSVLTSPDVPKEVSADTMDFSALNDPRECDMKYEQLGTWSCEVNIPDAMATAPEGRTLKLVGAKVIFEPLPAR